MNSIWNKNLHLLRQRFPDLYSLIQENLVASLPTDEQIPLSFPCGWQVYKARNEELSAKENGTNLHSSYNPSQEAINLAKSILAKQQINSTQDVTVFCGFGLGYAPIALANQNPSATLILIEPDVACFTAALYCIDFSKLFSLANFALLIGAALESVVTVLEYYGLSRCYFVRNKGIAFHAKQYFDNLDILIERNLSKNQINKRTLEKFSSLWQKNSCKNLLALTELDGVSRYKDTATNLSAFILAAGPSLNQVLPHLKEIKERGLLICVDTALRACLRTGIEPDFVILVDPQYWNSRHITGLSSPTAVLITELAAYPSTFRFNCREKILCSSLYPVGKYFESICGTKGQLAAGGSVATTAWDFARYCGCKEIYFAGLDLGFPAKQTHAKGSLFEERFHANSNRINTAEVSCASAIYSAPVEIKQAYDGSDILTDSRMSLYAWWFESKTAAFPQQKTYSLSSRSLKIPGISFFPLDKLLEKPSALKEKTHFFKKETLLKKEFQKNTLDRERKFLFAKETLLEGFTELYELANKGKNLCKKVLSNINSISFPQDYNHVATKLKEIDIKIMGSKITEAASLVFPNEQKLEEIFKSCNIPQDPMAASLFKSNIIYQEIITAVRGYRNLLSE
ncbi:MAG: motility associated factor glycosyltransferase family protein [Spirochaetaceae bacterium]|nr:motility associated factor glycosyltransferase family protein [Spirochaetaceae bacterium]